MIIRAVNHDDLHIDEHFESIDDLKTKINEKYGIPIDSQYIVFNGNYILGLFDHPLVEGHTYSNPFSCYRCPDDSFNHNLTVDDIKIQLDITVDDQEEEKKPKISETIDISNISRNLIESHYRNINHISDSFTHGEKILISRNLDDYITTIIEEFNHII